VTNILSLFFLISSIFGVVSVSIFDVVSVSIFDVVSVSICDVVSVSIFCVVSVSIFDVVSVSIFCVVSIFGVIVISSIFIFIKLDGIQCFEKFSDKYLNEEGRFTVPGERRYLDDIAGHVSYLNREKDATQFAQPIMINVPILMSHIENEELRDAVYLNTKFNNISKDAEELIEAIKIKVKSMKADYKTKKQNYKETKSALPKEEAKVLNEELKEIMEKIKELQDELHNNKETQKDSKDKVKELKAKVKRMKDSLLQEYILFTKCNHLKYKKNTTRKIPKLLK
jgi:gas vesicle protein